MERRESNENRIGAIVAGANGTEERYQGTSSRGPRLLEQGASVYHIAYHTSTFKCKNIGSICYRNELTQIDMKTGNLCAR